MNRKILPLIAVMLLFAFGSYAQCDIGINPNAGNGISTKGVTQAKDLVMITHSSSQDLVGGIGVVCGSGGLHTDNSLFRVFDLENDFGITEDITIARCDVGIETATAGAGGIQPGSVKLYSLDGAFTIANLTLLGEESFDIPDGDLYMIEHTLATPIVVPAGTVLVYEFFMPNGQTDGNSMYPGGNALGETDDTYIAAADCGLANPVTYSSIGFTANHLVMNVWYDVATDPEVTFAVDMNTQIMVGDFVPGTDVVYIAGSPWSWAAPGDDATLELLDGDANGIYEGTYTVTAGDIQYKYFQNAGWDGGEWPGDPNRMYTVTTSVTLNDLWAYEYLTTFTVTDGTNAVEGATIDVEATTYTATFSTTTDVNGMGYFATINGSYDYTVTMTGFETVTGSFDVDGANVPVDVVLTAGINEISSQINVYPNPSQGVFNINVDGAFDLEVYDITGKVINTQVVKGSTQLELDAAGVYFLRFSNEEGSVTQRVIVQ